MNHESIGKKLPLVVLLLAIPGMILRWALYAFCMDDKLLLPVNHPLEICLWGITAIALGIIGIGVWKLDGSNKYKDNFKASSLAAVGNVLGGMGIFLTVLLNAPLLSNNLGKVWKLLGFLSAPALLTAAWYRFRGKRPFFLLHIVPCLFLVMHIINHYQLWSGNPQLQDYVFTLFGTMAWMFFCFYSAAFDVGSGKRRMHLCMGLAGIYLCIVNLPQGEHLFLYLGGIGWMLSDLCTLTPKPRTKRKAQEEPPHEAA